jgi:hypothetical protein
MRVYDLQNNEGQIYAFEVKTAEFWWGRSGLLTVIRKIPEVQIQRAPYFLELFTEDVFCEFDVNGQRFEVWEPYGDSDRYWIGPDPPQPCAQLELVRTVFLNYSKWQGVRRRVAQLLRKRPLAQE